jgi:hypothetical protein
MSRIEGTVGAEGKERRGQGRAHLVLGSQCHSMSSCRIRPSLIALLPTEGGGQLGGGLDQTLTA